MRKVTSQISVFREAFAYCDVDAALRSFPNVQDGVGRNNDMPLFKQFES